MPLHWTIESRPPLVTVVAEGDVSRQDIEEILTLSRGADIIKWRKLFDAREGHLLLTLQDVNELGVRLRQAAAVRKIGPLAFVLPETGTPELMRLLGFLGAAKRPMRIFREIAPARRWILKTPQ